MVHSRMGLNPCFNGIWSRTYCDPSKRQLLPLVLILVLMEYGLGHQGKWYKGWKIESLNPCFNGIWSRTKKKFFSKSAKKDVLILVLMEYGLGRNLRQINEAQRLVLILVLMEYGLGPRRRSDSRIHEWIRLNPCFNGIWSRTMRFLLPLDWMKCLNPCFNGIWSRT